MSKIAIAVQRCHPQIVGGSETLAWEYARLLRSDCEVDILTTTAVDYLTWANALRPGVQEQEGIRIRRFPVTLACTPYRGELNRRLLQEYGPWLGRAQEAGFGRRIWSRALEEEYIRHLGPYSAPYLNYLETHAGDYQAILFVTYLFPTSYFGMLRVPPERALLVPTLHDEPSAYLRVFRAMAHRARSVVWLSDAERRLGRALWGELPGRVAAMPVEAEQAAPARLGYPYLLYCGRIDRGKGCDTLIDFFLRWKAARRNDVRLVLTGEDKLGVPAHPEIENRGFVATAEKQRLMAGAAVFVMPSPLESLSLATLEALAQGAAPLVNGACAVLVDHVTRSGVGRAYTDYESFCAALDQFLGDAHDQAGRQARGRGYVVSRYSADGVRAALLEELRLAG